MPVAGGPGVLLVLETDDGAARRLACRRAGRRRRAGAALPAAAVPAAAARPRACPAATTGRRSVRGGRRRLVRRRAARRAAGVALVVGDAVGHGVPAAGAMSRLRGAMRSSTLRDPSPGGGAGGAGRVRRPDGRRRGRLGVLRRPRRRHRPAHLRRRRAPARRWSSHADGSDVVPAGDARGRRWAACPDADDRGRRARARAGRDARAVLQRRRRRRTATARPRRWTGWPTSPATVLRARARWRPTPPPGWPRRSPSGVRRPQGWPDDVAVLVAHRRAAALRAAAAGPAGRPAALPGRPPAARRAGWPASAWASRTGSA